MSQEVTSLEDVRITLTGKDVDSRAFANALNKLCAHAGFEPKIAYNISYIQKKVMTFTQEVIKLHSESINKHSTKGEDGKMVIDEKGNFSLTDENKELYSKDLASIHEIKLDINKRKLDVEALHAQGLSLTPNDISALEPLLCGLDD